MEYEIIFDARNKLAERDLGSHVCDTRVTDRFDRSNVGHNVI